MINKKFKYCGETTDISGVPCYEYSSQKWIIDIWVDSSPNKPMLPMQGTVENMQNGSFEFSMTHGMYVSYCRILESQYGGLGTRYDESDRIVPKYVLECIRSIGERLVSGEKEWYIIGRTIE